MTRPGAGRGRGAGALGAALGWLALGQAACSGGQKGATDAARLHGVDGQPDVSALTDASASTDVSPAPVPDDGRPADARRDATPGVDAKPDGPGPDAAAPCAVGPEWPCPGGTCVLATARAGEVVSIAGYDLLSVPEPPLRVASQPGRTLLSRSPTYATAPAVLYRDVLAPAPLSNRLFLLHANAGTRPAKLALVVENSPGGQLAAFSVTRHAFSAPGTDLPAIGQSVLRAFLGSGAGASGVLAPGEVRLVDPGLDAVAIPPGQLVHALYELQAEPGMRAWITMLGAGEPSTFSYMTPPRAMRDGLSYRGTFDTPDRQVKIHDACALDTRGGVRKIRLGGNTVQLPAVGGWDDLDGSPERLYGDYGARLVVTLEPRAGDGRRLAVLLEPRSPPYAGVVEVATGGSAPVRIDVPGTGRIESLDQAALLARVPGGTTVTIVWHSPGGAVMPVDLLLVPVP